MIRDTQNVLYRRSLTIYKLKFRWLKFGEARMTRQIRQTFPLPNIPTIWYITIDTNPGETKDN